MKIYGYFSIGLLFVSLFGTWDTGYSKPLILELISPDTANITPEFMASYTVSGIFFSIILISVFAILIFCVKKSQTSIFYNKVGGSICLFLIFCVLGISFLSYAFQGFPYNGDKDISQLGYGPFLALIALFTLGYLFITAQQRAKSQKITYKTSQTRQSR